MLTTQQQTAFKREAFNLIQKLSSKTRSLSINEWVTIHPTGYGWRNAYRFGIVTNELSMLIDSHWNGGCYGTGNINGEIYYLFTGDALTFIINVPEWENPTIQCMTIYDTIDLSDFLNIHLTNEEIRSYINSSVRIVDDHLKNKSSLIKMIDGRDEIFCLKQKKLHAILSSYLIPMYCVCDSSYNPTEKLIKTVQLPIAQSTIHSMNEIIYSLTLNSEIFPFLFAQSAMFEGFTLTDSVNPTIN